MERSYDILFEEKRDPLDIKSIKRCRDICLCMYEGEEKRVVRGRGRKRKDMNK